MAPYTKNARLLLKDIWRISGQKWDNDLPEEIKKQFLERHSGLHLLGSLTIPRSYFTDPFDRIELHLLGDSPQDVFCAVAFLRARLASSHQTKLAFVFGKARLAPVKALSIRKLELQVALLATRLKKENLKGLTFNITDIFMWTDSTTVLQWPNSCNKYPFLLVIALVRFWSLTPLISGITDLAVITQLIPVHEGFLRKPSRKAAGLMALVY